MINYEYQNLFHEDSVPKKTIINSADGIRLTSADIIDEKIERSEGALVSSEVVFGCGAPKSIKFTIRADACLSLKGKTITEDIILNNDDSTMFRMGTYKVESDIYSDDRREREITAFDPLYTIINTDYSSWYASLTFPKTLKQFRDAFFLM